MSVTPSQFELLSQLMDASDLRHRIISQNVANVETPGYQRLEVTFEQQLLERLSRSGDLAKESVAPAIEIDTRSPARADGNNVNIDREMGKLNKNALLFQTYAQLLSSKLSMMRSAITGQ